MSTTPDLPQDEQALATLLADGLQGAPLIDLMFRMEKEHGPYLAHRMLQNASTQVDRDRVTAQAQAALAQELDLALTHLGNARNALYRLNGGDAWHKDYSGPGRGDDMDDFLRDAERYTRATIALNQPNNHPATPGNWRCGSCQTWNEPTNNTCLVCQEKPEN